MVSTDAPPLTTESPEDQQSAVDDKAQTQTHQLDSQWSSSGLVFSNPPQRHNPFSPVSLECIPSIERNPELNREKSEDKTSLLKAIEVPSQNQITFRHQSTPVGSGSSLPACTRSGSLLADPWRVRADGELYSKMSNDLPTPPLFPGSSPFTFDFGATLPGLLNQVKDGNPAPQQTPPQSRSSPLLPGLHSGNVQSFFQEPANLVRQGSKISTQPSSRPSSQTPALPSLADLVAGNVTNIRPLARDSPKQLLQEFQSSVQSFGGDSSHLPDLSGTPNAGILQSRFLDHSNPVKGPANLIRKNSAASKQPHSSQSSIISLLEQCRRLGASENQRAGNLQSTDKDRQASAASHNQPSNTSVPDQSRQFNASEKQNNEDTLFEKYQDRLRPSTKESHMQQFPGSWTDKDDSGDYHPSSKLLTTPTSVKRKRDIQECIHIGDSGSGGRAKRPKVSTWLAGRQRGDKKIVTFRFSSDAGRKILKDCLVLKLRPLSGNTPGEGKEVEEVDGDEEDEEDDDSAESDDEWTRLTKLRTQKPLADNMSMALRSRNVNARNFLANIKARREIYEHDAAHRFDHITRGHPFARGCKGCFEIKHKCPLVQSRAKWPCKQCVDDKIDCEIIVPPVLKRPCEHCNRANRDCSYSTTEDEDDHKAPCKRCQRKTLNCVAGPKLDQGPLDDLIEKLNINAAEVKKPDWDDDVEIIGSRAVGAKKPISDHEMDGIDWKFVSTLNLRQNIDAKTTLNLDIGTKPVTSKQPKIGEIKTIITSFAHPINFYHNPENSPCHFCADVTFGMYGNGETKVEVIDYKEGTGFIEISGGHRGLGKEATRMCNLCQLTRVNIVLCKEHVVCHLDNGLDPTNHDDILGPSMLAQGFSLAECPVDFCSICPNLAFYGCCAKQELDLFQEKIENDESQDAFGCGLRLCEGCANAVADSGGQLNDAMSFLRKQFSAWRLSLRADHRFLLSSNVDKDWHG